MTDKEGAEFLLEPRIEEIDGKSGFPCCRVSKTSELLLGS